MRKLKYKLSEIRPRIFLLKFEEQYQCNMTFLRYQEYYESSSPKFRNKSFSLVDFMDWYTNESPRKDRTFNYTVDWGGFNIPSRVIKELLKKGIKDPNPYDAEMNKVYQKCLKVYPDGKFYFVGTINEGWMLKHEVAHGLFYTVPAYKKEMLALVKKLKPKLVKRLYSWLKSSGYTPSVYDDEVQAYLSTGFTWFSLDGADAPFIQVFNKYYGK